MKFLRWIIVSILLILGLLLIFMQPIANHLWSRQTAMVTPVSQVKKNDKKVSYNFKQVHDLTTTRLLQAQLSKKQFIGAVFMPDIKMSVPISLGVSDERLAQGAGTLRANDHMGQGNFAMAGHNMGNGSQILFGPLYTSAKVGQLVYLSDFKNVYVYKVDTVKQIAPTDVQVADNTKNAIITMTTCNESGNARILVRGRLVNKMSYSSTSSMIRNGLSQHVKM